MTQPLFSIGLFADCQYADADPLRLEDPTGPGRVSERRHYRLSATKLRAAVAVFNEMRVDAIVNLGDLVDRSLSDAEPLMQILAGAQAPIWSVAGNHDFTGWPVPVGAVFEALRMPAPYYRKSVGGFRFLFMDSNEVGQIEYPPGSPEHRAGTLELERLRLANRPNAFEWNGGIGENQMAWVRRQLISARACSERVILISHHPFFPTNSHNLLNDIEFCEMLQPYPEAVVAFSGHNHEGNFDSLGDLRCLTLRGMVEFEDNSFAIAHFFQDRIEVQGFGRETSIVLEIA